MDDKYGLSLSLSLYRLREYKYIKEEKKREENRFVKSIHYSRRKLLFLYLI
jgi:hypothetical protein